MSIVEKYLQLKKKDNNFLGIDLNLVYSRKLEQTDKAIDIINHHMKLNHKILIYTDYDTDS